MATKAKQADTIVAHPDWNTAQQMFFQRLRESMPTLMAYLGEEIPVLDNHSDAQLVDETGVLKKVKKTVEKAEKTHVERLKARMGNKKALSGSAYQANYKGTERTILNQGMCKELIQGFEDEGIALTRLLQAIKQGNVKLSSEAFLTDPVDDDDIPESNMTSFYTTTPGNALYVDIKE